MKEDASENITPGEVDATNAGSKTQPPQLNRPSQNVVELMTVELPKRAARTDPKLRSQLVGTLMFKFRGNTRNDSGKIFSINWSSPEFVVLQQAVADPDCVLEMNEDIPLRIANGDLNPQLAMLSDKIKVSGKARLAVYFFNLLAPRRGE